jgi:hypothetical protein
MLAAGPACLAAVPLWQHDRRAVSQRIAAARALTAARPAHP